MVIKISLSLKIFIICKYYRSCLQIWKKDNCRGENLQNLQENLELLMETFNEGAKEYGHLSLRDGPKRKKKKTDSRPDQETLDAVRRSDWMIQHVQKILALKGLQNCSYFKCSQYSIFLLLQCLSKNMNVIYMSRIYEEDHVGVLFVTISDFNLGQNNRKLKNRRSWNVADIDTWVEMISKNVWTNSASFKNIFGCYIKRSINFEKKFIVIIKKN